MPRGKTSVPMRRRNNSLSRRSCDSYSSPISPIAAHSTAVNRSSSKPPPTTNETPAPYTDRRFDRSSSIRSTSHMLAVTQRQSDWAIFHFSMAASLPRSKSKRRRQKSTFQIRRFFQFYIRSSNHIRGTLPPPKIIQILAIPLKGDPMPSIHGCSATYTRVVWIVLYANATGPSYRRSRF